MRFRNLAALRSVSFVWIGAILGAGFAFLVQVVLARGLDPSAYGVFAAALGVVMLLTPLASFGVPGFWLKAFGNEGWTALRWLRGSFVFAMGSTCAVVCMLWLWAYFGPHDDLAGRLILLLSCYLFGQMAVEMVVAKYQLEERYPAVATWQAIPHLVRLLALVSMLFLFDGLDLISIGAVYALIAAGTFLLATAVLRHMYVGPLRLKGHGPLRPEHRFSNPKTALSVAGQAWPFGVANAFFLIYYQSDIILLKYLDSDQAAGIYNVAFIIMAAVYLLPGVTYQKYLMPKIHRWYAHDRKMFSRVYRQGNLAMLGLGLVAAFCLWLLADFGVGMLFGASYMAAVAPLMVLAAGAPVRFVATSVESVLVSRSNMRLRVKIMATTALANIAMNLVMIPMYGIMGAAIATVVSDVLLLVLYLWAVKRNVFNGRPAV